MYNGDALGEGAQAISNRINTMIWVASDRLLYVSFWGSLTFPMAQHAQFPLTWNSRPRPVFKRENNLIDAMMTECWSTNIQNLWFTIRHCQRLQTNSFLTMKLAEQPAQHPGPFTDVHLFLAPNRKLATFWATWETGWGNKSKEGAWCLQSSDMHTNCCASFFVVGVPKCNDLFSTLELMSLNTLWH